MLKFLAGCHYNEEEISRHLKKIIGCWPVQINGNKFATGQILKKTLWSCEGTDFSWLSSKVSRTLLFSTFWRVQSAQLVRYMHFDLNELWPSLVQCTTSTPITKRRTPHLIYLFQKANFPRLESKGTKIQRCSSIIQEWHSSGAFPHPKMRCVVWSTDWSTSTFGIFESKQLLDKLRFWAQRWSAYVNP
jgi:hypothetical protein